MNFNLDRKYCVVLGAVMILSAAVFASEGSAYAVYPPIENQGKSQALIKRGEYLTQAGDCIACHTKKGGKPFIHLATSRTDYKKGPKYTTWPVALEDVVKIFMKPNKSSNIEMGHVQTKNLEIITQINKLVVVVKQQRARLDKQEEDIRRLYTLLSRVSNMRQRSGTRSR